MARPGPKTVGVCWPSGEHVLASFAFLIRTFQHALDAHFETRSLPEYIYQLAPDAQARMLERFVREADVLFVWHPRYPSLLRALLLARNAHAPDTRVIYATLGELPLGATWLRPSLHLLRPGDRVLTNCEADRRILGLLTDSLCCPAEVFPLWVDTDLFTPHQDAIRRSARADLGVDEEAVLFLYVGRITPEKNVHAILQLFAHLQRDVPHARLVLAGPLDNIPFFSVREQPGDLRSDLAHLLQRTPRLASRTLVLAERFGHDALRRLYAAADVFVNFTLHHGENFGLANVEAMSAGLPVVASDWGGLRDTVEHGETGYRVPTYQGRLGEHVDLWQAGEHCRRLAGDPGLRAQLGAAGRARVERLYALQDLPERLRSILETTMAVEGPTGETRLSEFGRIYHRAFFSEDDFDFLPRYDDRTMELYRALIAPYCTSRMVDGLDPHSRLFLASPFVMEQSDGGLAIVDPVWPGARQVGGTAEQALVSALLASGFASLEEALRILPDAAESTIRALLDRGVLVHGREVD